MLLMPRVHAEEDLMLWLKNGLMLKERQSFSHEGHF
jgi:hypothetical protein